MLRGQGEKINQMQHKIKCINTGCENLIALLHFLLGHIKVRLSLLMSAYGLKNHLNKFHGNTVLETTIKIIQRKREKRTIRVASQ